MRTTLVLSVKSLNIVFEHTQLLKNNGFFPEIKIQVVAGRYLKLLRDF